MKRDFLKWIAILLLCAFVIGLGFVFDYKYAYADGLTLEMVSSAAYAVAQNYGIIFNYNNGNGDSAKTWIKNEVNSYLAGRSISEVFGAEAIRLNAGKLIVPGLVYAGLKNMWEQYIYEKSISSSGLTDITQGYTSFGVELGVINQNGYFSVESNPSPFDATCTLSYYKNGIFSHNGFYSAPVSGYHNNSVNGVQTVVDGDRYRNWVWFSGINSSNSPVTFRFSWYPGMTVANYPYYGALKIGLNEDYGFPEVSDYGSVNWEGTIGDGADTNLEDLMQDIFDDVGINDLVVDGEIVEPGPGPVPTPVPSYPPADDILPGINTGIEIGNDIIAGQAAQTGVITQGLEVG